MSGFLCVQSRDSSKAMTVKFPINSQLRSSNCERYGFMVNNKKTMFRTIGSNRKVFNVPLFLRCICAMKFKLISSDTNKTVDIRGRVKEANFLSQTKAIQFDPCHQASRVIK